MADPTNEQWVALQECWTIAQRDHGGAIVLAKLLLGLYNGDRFPFDLTQLRGLDVGNFEYALELLRMDYKPAREVHAQLAALHGDPTSLYGYYFELRAYELRMKGRCKKEALDDMRQRLVARGVLKGA